MLDLMQPSVAGRQLIGFSWEARRNEAGRKSTQTGKHHVGIDRQLRSRLKGPRGCPAGATGNPKLTFHLWTTQWGLISVPPAVYEATLMLAVPSRRRCRM